MAEQQPGADIPLGLATLLELDRLLPQYPWLTTSRETTVADLLTLAGAMADAVRDLTDGVRVTHPDDPDVLDTVEEMEQAAATLRRAVERMAEGD